jgi:hypothetical protein
MTEGFLRTNEPGKDELKRGEMTPSTNADPTFRNTKFSSNDRRSIARLGDTKAEEVEEAIEEEEVE